MHHEARNDSTEVSCLVMKVSVFALHLTCTESSEIFGCFRYLLLEKFYHDSAFRVVFITFLPDFDVHEYLWVTNIELRHQCSVLEPFLFIEATLEHLF